MEGKSQGALRVLVLLAASAPAIAQYVGTSPSGDPPATPTTTLAQDFSINPKNGQTREQQSADLYQCYSWAKGQAGFDPTQANGGVAADQVSAKREEYRRAMTICLRARGYDVHYATAGAASLAAPLAATPAATSPPPDTEPQISALGPPELKYQPLAVQIAGGYTATTGRTSDLLDGGGNIGAGITWFISPDLPIGIRADGSYMWFGARNALLNENGGNWAYGHSYIWGGDADVQLDLAHRSSSAKLYLLGGIGWYRQQVELKQVSIVNGIGCWPFFCGPAQFPAVTAVDRYTSEWHRSWNAGLGAEFAVGDHASFFVEARYLVILPYSSKVQLVPVRVGLRF
jgi:opacity protein-like surface antigen